jgi:acetyl-CoA C-acetyltransferase
MLDAVICSPLRTPVGRYGGVLRDVSPQELAAVVIRAIVEREQLDPAEIDDVILGNANPSGEFPAVGRVAALDAGLPVTVPGSQVDRRCGSGLYSVLIAAMQVQTGQSRLVLAGGTESMSSVEYYTSGFRFDHPAPDLHLQDRLARARVTAGGREHPVPGGMLETAENLRAEFSIPREEQDLLALESHRRAVAAQEAGLFAEEIVPVRVRTRRGETVVDTDEHPRADATLESLSALRPIRAKIDPDATVTAGNASGQNDGAAVCIVTTPDEAQRRGLTPLARLVSSGTAGLEPHRMGLGPVSASALALERAGLTLADMDLIELNEAFAAQALAVTRVWGLGEKDGDRVNVNGSGISLGHPVGATGCRMLSTLLREMQRREVRYGLETMCIGGGQGLAVVWERVA